MPTIRAVCSLTEKCPWLLDHTVRYPSSCHIAVAEWGSMYPWWTATVETSFSTMTSASLNPLSTSPKRNSSRLATLVLPSVSSDARVPPAREDALNVLASRSCSNGALSAIASLASITGVRTS